MTAGGTAPGRRAAVIAPGGGYGPDAPLLMYAGLAARRRGAQPHPVTWDLPGTGGDLDDLAAMVCARVSAVLDSLDVASPVLIGKSLGSLAAPVAAGRGLAAVWLTPLLTRPAAVAALRRATRPFLLVGGTADKFWDGDLARSLTPYVTEVDGADHGMLVPGPLAASAAVLGEVTTAVERFLDDVAWPAH